MSTTCINLREQFGKRFKIAYEESYCADRGDAARADDPWLQIIPCQRGHIYPHGGNLLAVATNGRGPTPKAIRSLPGVEVVQDGDDGINATYPVEIFNQVAKLMKPRRRRQLTAEQKAANSERLRKFQFPAARKPPEIERQRLLAG